MTLKWLLDPVSQMMHLLIILLSQIILRSKVLRHHFYLPGPQHVLDKFLLAVELRDLSQADKSIIRLLSSFPI